MQFYDISSRNQSLDDLCGQEDEDKDDSGLYDLRAVFDGESRADEMEMCIRDRGRGSTGSDWQDHLYRRSRRRIKCG